MQKIRILIKIKRFFSSNKLFWKYRHLIQRNYALLEDSELNKISDFYIKTVKKYDINSVLDFGFGKGELLKQLQKKTSISYFFGIDINKNNIFLIKKFFDEKNSFFITEFNQNFIQDQLDTRGIDKIDLIVFDRVLYIFNDKELHTLFRKVSHFASKIIIDDFSSDNYFGKSEYKHRDWVKILEKYNFMCELQIDSVNGSPNNTCSKTFLFTL